MAAGTIVWLLACLFPEFAQWATGRIVLGSLIVSTYTFLTSAELRRERRKALLRHWPAIFVPVLHGAVFLFPIPLVGLLPANDGVVSLASGWIAVFVIETMLYVVGTAFIVLVLAKEETARIYKDAASTDALTGLLNRRGLLPSAQRLVDRSMKGQEPMSVLTFDLDHFKLVNDRFGHRVGDETLRLFAAVASANLRASDLIGRFGAERIRSAFEAAATSVAHCDVGATVSIGVASDATSTDLASLLIRSDAALYRAKAKGRNRIEVERDEIPTIFTTAPSVRLLDPLIDGSVQWTARRHARGAALAA
jgi:GGDEF domain-containing protein